MISNIGWFTICFVMLMIKHVVLVPLEDARQYKKNREDEMKDMERDRLCR